jgi:Na+-translocating ferredoxin:NAD+ oxidoreductase subunit C
LSFVTFTSNGQLTTDHRSLTTIMRYFDVRQTGGLSRGAPWPAQPAVLRLLDLPTRLQVPLVAKSPPGPVPHLSAGAVVAKGERLSHMGVGGSATALAPTSGRVIGTSTVQLLNGQMVPAVDIEPDFEDRPVPGEMHDALHAREQHEQIEGLTAAGPEDLPEWIDRLRNAGVWSDRPGSPDLLAQLHHLLRNKVDTIVCNLLDDEPTMRLNPTLAVRAAPLLVAGLRLLASITSELRRVTFVIEAGSPSKWWSPLRRAMRDSEWKSASAELAPVLNDYPQGDPTMLLYSLMDRRLKPRLLPVDQRVLMLDAAAAISVGRVAARDQPMLQVPLAVRDHLRQLTHYVVAPVGMPLRQLLRQCEAPADGVTLRRGAVLRENDVTPDAVVCGGDLTLHVMPEQVSPMPDPCIRCTWCVESCPTRVQPAGLLEASQSEDLGLGAHYGLDACIECGVCSYVCPSRLPLLRGIRKLKSMDKTRRGLGDTPS